MKILLYLCLLSISPMTNAQAEHGHIILFDAADSMPLLYVFADQTGNLPHDTKEHMTLIDSIFSPRWKAGTDFYYIFQEGIQDSLNLTGQKIYLNRNELDYFFKTSQYKYYLHMRTLLHVTYKSLELKYGVKILHLGCTEPDPDPQYNQQVEQILSKRNGPDWKERFFEDRSEIKRQEEIRLRENALREYLKLDLGLFFRSTR